MVNYSCIILVNCDITMIQLFSFWRHAADNSHTDVHIS